MMSPSERESDLIIITTSDKPLKEWSYYAAGKDIRTSDLTPRDDSKQQSAAINGKITITNFDLV
jgi:hypothetical protein